MADEATSTAVVETSDDGTSTEAVTEPASAETTDAASEAALGDAGKKALDAMKAERKAAREQAAAEKARADSLQAQIDGNAAEHAANLAAQKVKDDALGAANQRILKAEVRLAAAGKLADPTDALAYLDLASFEVNDDGEPDSSAIAAAIDELISKKPYLKAQRQGFQGSADQGARNDSRPAQLTRDDLSRLSPAEIVKAEADGRLSDLLGGKS